RKARLRIARRKHNAAGETAVEKPLPQPRQRRVCGYISNVSKIDPKLYILKWLDARSTGVHCFRQRKETIEIATRLPPDFLRRESPQFTQLPRDLLYKRRLVALAAMRHRCQVGRVRLNQHAIQWNLFGCILNLLRFWKRHIAGERDHKSQIEGTFGVPDGSSETMQDPAQSTWTPMFLDQAET